MTMDEIRAIIADQERLPSCTNAQREANKVKLNWYEFLLREKEQNVEPRPTLMSLESDS